MHISNKIVGLYEVYSPPPLQIRQTLNLDFAGVLRYIALRLCPFLCPFGLNGDILCPFWSSGQGHMAPQVWERYVPWNLWNMFYVPLFMSLKFMSFGKFWSLFFSSFEHWVDLILYWYTAHSSMNWIRFCNLLVYFFLQKW